MAGEPILIVDDTPVNLKLTRILLVNEGYQVQTAASAEEALELLGTFHPALILADIQLPGIDGLEFTRRVKRNEKTREIIVVALTAFAMSGDEQKAREAGCDGYITKPIDTRSLGQRIRQYLDELKPTPAAAPQPACVRSQPKESIEATEMDALKHRFLAEGQEHARQLLLDIDGPFNAADAARAVHQWIGTGGLLGYPAISKLSREVETVLLEKPLDNAQLRESLTNLVVAFNTPREARERPLPESILEPLAGRHVAVVGFPEAEKERMAVALQHSQAQGAFFAAGDGPDSAEALACNIAAVYIDLQSAASPWLTSKSGRPMIFAGAGDDLLGLPPELQAIASGFLIDAWMPDEAVVRLSLALSRQNAPAAAGPVPARPLVVIADAEPNALSMIRTVLQNSDMDCRTAVDGASAVQLIRTGRPHVAVLDVDMPGMDGYGVLEAVRADQNPVSVLLLTGEQREDEVVRGFALGADDFVSKPFSPAELAARVKLLLARCPWPASASDVHCISLLCAEAPAVPEPTE